MFYDRSILWSLLSIFVLIEQIKHFASTQRLLLTTSRAATRNKYLKGATKNLPHTVALPLICIHLNSAQRLSVAPPTLLCHPVIPSHDFHDDWFLLLEIIHCQDYSLFNSGDIIWVKTSWISRMVPVRSKAKTRWGDSKSMDSPVDVVQLVHRVDSQHHLCQVKFSHVLRQSVLELAEQSQQITADVVVHHQVL